MFITIFRMKFTCLSQGKGYHFPPCHILDLCGFRILLDCPLDLSTLSAFAPIAAHLSKNEADASNPSPCINVVPWYKTVNSLHLWDASFIDVVLISSPMGMLGLPFLTRKKGFSGKIYATEVMMKLGQLIMDDLISMHKEFKQIYGPEDSNWMKWEELEKLLPALKDMIIGEDGSQLGGWLPLYTTAEMKDCTRRVQPLRYGEEACYNGTLVIKAISSGLDIGTSNWNINTPKVNVAYICNSVVGSAQAMDFDYRSLQARDAVIYSDVVSFQNVEGDLEDANVYNEQSIESLLYSDETPNKEFEKLAFICSCAFDSLSVGGSVLIPINRLGVMLQLLDHISSHQELSSLKVPIFIISSASKELFSLMNVVPEWLSKQKQEKLFAGESLFSYVDLIKENRMHLIPDICSSILLKVWQEPCIVLCPHGSLRLGPAVHLLRRWRSDANSLLVLEDGLDPDLALLPFKPMQMKVLQCSFLSGIKSQKIVPLIEKLQPKLVLFPKISTKLVRSQNPDSFPILQYSEDETIRISKLMTSEVEIAIDLGSLKWKTVTDFDSNISRLRGELSMDHRKQRLLLGTKGIDSDSLCSRSLLHWGTLDVGRLLTVLEKMGIHGTVDQVGSNGSDCSCVVNVAEPNKAFIEVKPKSVVICTGDEKLAYALFEAIESILDGI